MEYSRTGGFLEIKGKKTKLVSRNDPLCERDLTDAQIRRVLELPAGREYSSLGMAWEGVLNAVQAEDMEAERTCTRSGTT